MSWKCDCCGQCCRHVDKVPALHELANDDGVCKYLDAENKCSIYDHRPAVCNVRWIYEHFFKPMGVSEDEYYAKTQEACNKLKNEVISIPASENEHA